MVLRKHLLGLHIKNITTNNLERLVIINFEGFDDIDDLISKRLIVELMGKHCNIILLNDENIIIDSLRHINSQDENSRTIVPHVKYEYPTTTKNNFLDCKSYEDFKNKIEPDKKIYDIFNGISKSFVEASKKLLKNDENLYDYINDLISKTESDELNFNIISTKNSEKKDYYLVKNNSASSTLSPFHLNFFIDDFYYNKETCEDFRTYRDNILKMIFSVLKKYRKRLLNINSKLQDCEDMEKYKLYGELITANLYQIKNENVKEITLINYYNNDEITILLDNKYTPAQNAKRFFKKYNKLKNALEIVSEQKHETESELNYIESIIYELESSSTLDDVSQIFEEISENVIFKEKTQNYKKQKNYKIKKSSLTKNKNISFNPIKYNIDGYTLLVGRNNKENDYLTLKFAKKTDLWFHTKEIHGSHAILQLDANGNNNLVPNENLLVKCAEIVAYHSKARNSSNVPVDCCEVKYVKKPSGSKPGMVIYKNQKTLYVNPRN